MDIIRKYKKSFIIVVIISFVLSLIPVLGLSLFVGMGSQMVEVVVENDVTSASFYESNDKTPYEPVELTMDATEMLASPHFIDGVEEITISQNISKSSTEQTFLYVAYLEAGTELIMTHFGRLNSGMLDFYLISEEGAPYSFSLATNKKITERYTIRESGNYGLLYHASEAKGNFDVTLKLIEPTN